MTGELSAERINVDGATIQADGDTLKIKNLGVDTLQIAGNAVTIPRSDTSASDVFPPDQVWTTLNTIVFSPANVSGSAQPVSVKAFIPFRAKDASNNPAFGSVEYRIRKNNVTVSGPLEFGRHEFKFIGFFPNTELITQGASTGSVTPIYLDVDAGLSQRSYTLEVKFTKLVSDWDEAFTIPAGAVLECTEVKR